MNLHDDHFKQWENDRSFARVIVSDPPFTAMLTQHLHNLPTDRGTEKTSFCPDFVNAPPLHSFLAQNSNLEHIKNKKVLKEHNVAILKTTAGCQLFDHYATDSDLHRLQPCVKYHVLSISSNAQHTQRKIKDSSLCKTSGRSELATVYLHGTNSLVASAKQLKPMPSARTKRKSRKKKESNASQVVILTGAC